MAKTGAERQQAYRDRKAADRARDRARAEPHLPGLPPRPEPEPPAAVDLLNPQPAPEAPQDGEKYSAWADGTLRVTAGARRGSAWRCLAWQREPVDLAGAGGTIVVLRAAAQSGKSSVGLVVAAGRMLLGEPVTIVAPSARPSASTFARERLEPMMASAPIASYLHSERTGGLAKSSALSYRTLATGASVSLVGAESPAQLASRGASTLLLDEVARFPAECGREGPPVPLALERTEAWRESRAVMITSTPVADGDELDAWFLAGDQRFWFVGCFECGHSWSPTWEHVVSDPPAIRCPQCGRRHEDGDEHHQLVEAGEWKATAKAEDPEVVSFHLPRWLSAASSLRACIADRRRAERRNRLATWTRTCAALPSDPDPVELPDITPLEARREADDWPPAVAQKFAGVDVQGDRLECLVLGLPPDRSWGAVLEYHVIRGRPQYREPWAALQEVFDSAGVQLAGVDAGFEPAPVRALSGRDRRVVALRGMGDAGRLPIAAPAASGWCHTVGADSLKRDVLQKVSDGWLRLPAAPWCTRRWLHSLTAEHEEVVERQGRRVTRWVQHFARNEALDTAVYALAVSNLVPHARTGRRRRLIRVA